MCVCVWLRAQQWEEWFLWWVFIFLKPGVLQCSYRGYLTPRGWRRSYVVVGWNATKLAMWISWPNCVCVFLGGLFCFYPVCLWLSRCSLAQCAYMWGRFPVGDTWRWWWWLLLLIFLLKWSCKTWETFPLYFHLCTCQLVLNAGLVWSSNHLIHCSLDYGYRGSPWFVQWINGFSLMLICFGFKCKPP